MWFDSSSVAHSTNPASFSKGLHLLCSQAVLSWSVHRVTPDEPLHWRLSGTVQGSRSSPYELDIEFHLLPDHKVGAWVSQCNCPILGISHSWKLLATWPVLLGVGIVFGRIA